MQFSHELCDNGNMYYIRHGVRGSCFWLRPLSSLISMARIAQPFSRPDTLSCTKSLSSTQYPYWFIVFKITLIVCFQFHSTWYVCTTLIIKLIAQTEEILNDEYNRSLFWLYIINNKLNESSLSWDLLSRLVDRFTFPICCIIRLGQFHALFEAIR